MSAPLPENFQTSEFASRAEPVWLLIQLPDGNWVDPSRVIRIEANARNERLSSFTIDRVILAIQEGPITFHKVIETPDFPSAQRLRDEIAALVNSTRAKQPCRT